MKPVRLEFKGLNSFSEKAVINFGPLLCGGIFGIFGETGSGKSTILDAINFALYGDIERNSDKLDKINYKCDELEVSFTFDISSEGARRTYTVERSIKRKSGAHKAMLYEVYANGKSSALADNVKGVTDRITDIIGINKEDFRKCIALPQGEFAQFVNSAASERIELIERLFSLQKYGTVLRAKLSVREKDADDAYSRLEGRLSAYEDATREALKEYEEKIVELQNKEEECIKAAQKAAAEYETRSKLYSEKLAYDKATARLEELRARKPVFDELKSVLPSLLFCERACENQSEAAACAEKISELLRDAKRLSAEESALSAELETAERFAAQANFEGNLEKVQKIQSAMESLLPAAYELEEKLRELAKCRDDYKKESVSLSSAQAEKNKKEEELFHEKKALESMPEPDIDEYFRKELRGGILKDEYAKNLGYFKDLQSELRAFADDSALYGYISKELNLKAEEYKELVLSVKDAKINVNEELKKFNDALKARRRAESRVAELSSILKNYEMAAENSAGKLENLRVNGEKLRAEILSLKKRLDSVFGEERTDYAEQAKKASEELQRIKKQRNELSDRMESLKQKIALNQKLSAKTYGEADGLSKQKKKAEECVEDNVKKAGAADVSACRSLISEYGGYEQAAEKYHSFDKAYAAAEIEAARYKEYEGIENVSAEVVALCFKTKNETENERNAVSGELAVLKNKKQVLEKRLSEKREIEKEFGNIKRARDLIGKLKNLLQGNRFMEYIANEHLVNISRAASKTLIDLTDGRYFLEYIDNNFYVGDNYNGGDRRKVKTLSGGETFLVSLSLALALSSTICTRSLKSIEFFFLDEGFGTLDGDLIETVLGALEKLKSADFSIGLISHVEELKHRISSKILVSKATESHGSTIKISC